MSGSPSPQYPLFKHWEKATKLSHCQGCSNSKPAWSAHPDHHLKRLLFSNYPTKPFSLSETQFSQTSPMTEYSLTSLNFWRSSWSRGPTQRCSELHPQRWGWYLGDKKTTAQQAPASRRSHQHCFSFCSCNASCCTNLKASLITKAQELLQPPPHHNPSCIQHASHRSKSQASSNKTFAHHCFPITVTSKNYRCHLLDFLGCNTKPDCPRQALTYNFFHQW